ncbi:hypothetical protein [Amycolatopsis sp. NPDC054798]
MRDPGTVVGRLRIRAPRRPGSPFASAPAGLDRVRWRPAGLGPSAVLVVRRLADPRPGTVRLGEPDGVPPGWQRAVIAELDDELSHAARPWREAVPAAANAVLFADHAELLAAMAADWLSGALGNHWWWRLMERTSSTVDLVEACWCDSPRAVPPALGTLAARGQAVAFARSLPEAVAVRVADSLFAEYGVPQDTAVDSGRTATEFPQVSRFPEVVAPGLTVGQRLLLCAGLALARVPATAVRPGFLSAVRAWHVRARAAEIPLPETSVVSVRGESIVDSGYAGKHRNSESLALPAELAVEHIVEELRQDLPAPIDAPTEPERPSVREAFAPVEAAAGQVSPDYVHMRQESVASERLTESCSPLPDQPVDTELGGLFFLLNLALHLGLYGDFTTPTKSGITLHPFELVARLGRELLSEPYPEDPGWALLDALAGDEPSDFTPPTEWRVPPEWLDPFPPGEPWLWSSARGRLRVRHPAGFDVLDTTSPALPADRIRQEFPSVELRQHPLPAPPTEPLRRWVAALADYARARLALALDCPQETSGDLLLRLPARIVVGPAHVDVRFALAALPIEVRLAGLDRDPGWLPAAARTVTFQFD